MGKCHKGSFSGGSNINLNLITCSHKSVITSILQSYALHWDHTHILHTVMYRTESIISQNLCWPGIREDVQKEVKMVTLVNVKKRPNKKYGKLPATEAEETPWKKLCIHLISP